MVDKERQLRVFTFIEKLHTLEGDVEGIQEAVVDELRWYGLDYATCAEIPALGRVGEELILLNTRPMDYVRHYVEEEHALRDPVITEMQNTVNPYSWEDIRARRKLSKRQKDILDEGSAFGFNNGFLVPIVSDNGSISIFSPCGWNPDLSPESRVALEVIGTFAVQALRRCRKLQQRSDKSYEPLTSREREILQFVAAGKADHEIGDILSIAESTVSTHMQNIKRKLGVARRTYAIVRGIQLGEIYY